MKNHILLIFGISFCLSCNETTEKKPVSINIDSIPKNEPNDSIINSPTEQVNPENKIEKIDFDFLSECDSLQIWNGGIQGVKTSDSTGPFIMAQCFSNKHFDLIVFSNRDIDLKEASNYKENRIIGGIKDAEYYAFEIPKKIPEEPENEFDTYDYVFPSDVKVFKLFEDGWHLIKNERVDSFEELGRIKMNTIYKK